MALTSIGYLHKYIWHRLTSNTRWFVLAYAFFDPKNGRCLARLQRRSMRQERAGIRALDGFASLQPAMALPRLVSERRVATKPLESALAKRAFELTAHKRCRSSNKRWPEQQTSLKNIVFADAWCPLEWWTLGRWLDQSGKDISTMPFFVAQWNPVWALAAPTHMHLGWQIGLQALHAQVSTIGQDPNMLESIDGSQCWSLETS